MDKVEERITGEEVSGAINDDVLHLYRQKFSDNGQEVQEEHVGSYPLVNIRKWRYVHR